MKSHAPLPWTAVGGGLLAVALFSLTMPLMRLAVRELDPTVIGVGRMLISAVPAVIVLGFIGLPRLSWSQFGRLCLVTGCLVFGFAWLTAIALRTVPSHHAAIVGGGIPLATAVAATLTGGRRPSAAFGARRRPAACSWQGMESCARAGSLVMRISCCSRRRRCAGSVTPKGRG